MKKPLVILAVLVVAGLIVYFNLNKIAGFLIVADPLAKADVIIVLAGDSNGERVAEGVKLYQQGWAKKILMSGGPLAWHLTSAERMKKQAVYLGVLAQDVYLEDQSLSTLENAKFSLPIVKKYGFKKVILVTSLEHTRRSRHVFHKFFDPAGITVITHPAPNSLFKLDHWWQDHESVQRVFWEYSSLVYYLMKGH